MPHFYPFCFILYNLTVSNSLFKSDNLKVEKFANKRYNFICKGVLLDMLYDKLLKEVRFMWFKKKSKATIVIDINDINSYIIKNYVPTEEELKPKHTVREQTVDHIVDHTDDHIVDHSQIKYSIRDNVNFSISDERDYSHIQNILSDKKLDDIKKLENIICESFSDALMKHIK